MLVFASLLASPSLSLFIRRVSVGTKRAIAARGEECIFTIHGTYLELKMLPLMLRGNHVSHGICIIWVTTRCRCRSRCGKGSLLIR